ncbi:hypothetical protein [Klebsiella quasipneumoniae]|uniref:hypothetical protein n=1 Tax=Klebsiella quasipneumoniae TaxID=1463165 RepID=UPI002995A901|nr:hypothetical protein [Klebsiella quasipneumoniae subsp. similipneumoniae]HDH1446858.1 hypothetical protein [Klebsiella quasipneumoniae subsp. similipneumoniae]
MKVNPLIALAILALLWPAAALRAAVTKTTWSDAPAREFVFVENNSDDNFFVTPGGALDPRMTGANRWTGLKYTGSGTIYQQSLGYIDNGYNTGLNANWKFDMWLENSPVSHPLTGLRCINWYAGCDMATSLILPQTTDASGFYGATVTSGGAKWMHGMMSDAFYQYLQQMPVGGSFTMTINACQTSVNYDASSGARCKDQASGNWYVRNVTHTKAANLRLINTHSLAEVFINSDGVPTLGEGNADCRTQTIGSRSGLSCKMVNYTLQTNGLSNTSIHIFPAIANSSLASAVGAYDMQFSLNGSSWKPVSNTAYYYTFNEMKSSDDGTAKVPFPATLSFITRSGATQTYDAGCDDSWRDMTDALWLTTPWTDISGEVGQMDKTTVKFSIPMDNAISLRTVDDNGWFGEVSASGEIHVQATWRNIN